MSKELADQLFGALARYDERVGKERSVFCSLRLETDSFDLTWVCYDSARQGHIEIKFLEREQALGLAAELLRREVA